MRKIMKRSMALSLAAAMALSMAPSITAYASTTNVSGTAPFNGTWLVSGPYSEPVVEQIYGLAGGSGDVEIPSPEFNQTEQVFGIGKAGSIRQGSAEHRFTDGYTSTEWQSRVESGNNTTTFQMTLEYPADLTTLQLYGYYEASDTPETDSYSVRYAVKNTAGKVLAEGTVKGLTNGDSRDDMQAVQFENVLSGAAVIEFTMDTTEETNGHACTGKYYGMREVYVYGLPPSAPDLSERGIEKIPIVEASADSVSGENEASYVLDGNDETAWQSDTKPGESESWETPVLTLTLDEEKIITSILLKGYEAAGTNPFAVNYELLDKEGNSLSSGTKYDVTGSKDEQVIGLNYGVTGVSQIRLSIDPSNGGTTEPDDKAGFFGIRSVSLQGMKLLTDSEELKYSSLEVSSRTSGNEAEKAFDQDESTMWRCDNRSGVTWDSSPNMKINFDKTVRLDSLEFSFYEESPEEGISRHVSCMLYDAAGKLVYSGGVMASDQQTSAFDFGIGAADISQIKLMINPSGITNGSDKLGFREISINGHLMEETADQPLGDISPVLGEMLEVPDGAEAGAWRYFDDRIFNRSQDDYNDLMGFFDVKRGEETLNNYVAAGVYVYSPKDQEVQWQMAGSGIYKLFCNDIPAGAQESVPGDVVKSGTKYSISLKEGWNKLLIQIQHVNPNQKCNLFGFYSRLCDSDGNEIEDLTYSVSGPYTEDGEVQIVTQGLDIDRADFEERNADCTANEYPENTLPYAYEKNPYVGLKSVNTSGSAGQASLFAFQAAGGSPEYTWEIVKGKLPDGLTLNADGTVSGTVEDGAAGDSTKDYTFTLKAEDAEGNTAEKEFTMTAKPHPAQWFEEGRMSALSHCTGTIPNLYDPNYNYDQWAQTAKEMGLTMLSTESYQNSLYYWPSPNANLTPNDSNAQYKYNTMYQDENGEWHIKDRVMEAKEAAERYGLHFGTYLSPQCPQTDIQGLVERYDPWYIFVDGNPQSGVNLDIAFSSARNYNDRVLFNTNPNKEISDQDLTLMERPFWYSQPYVEGGNWENNIKPSGKYVVHEEWNDPYSTALDLWRVWSPGGDQMRDSWPDAMKELIDAVGHGYVMNHDLSIAASRGLDNLIWSGAIRTSMDKDNIYMMVPIDSQQMSDMRVSMAEWLTNEGGPDLHESLFGTMPYYIEYTPAAGWHEAGTQLAFFYGEGPEWGYSLCRDQYVYLHMIENYIEKGRDKSGFTGQDTLEHIGPFDYKVKNVSWLNEGMELEYTQKESGGKYYIDIDTSSVESDPIDTIIKIETENPKREYSMTDIKVFSSQEEGSVLNLRTECYMNDFTSVFAPAEVSYVSLDEKVARTDAVGAVHAVGDGETEIRVTAVYDDGVNEKQVIEETYPVKVSGGNISSNLPLTGIGMFTNEKAFWSEVFAGTTSPVDLKGYTEYGGTVDLLPGVNTENITYHYAVVDGSTNNSEGKIVVTEVSADQVPFELKDGQLVLDEEAGTDKYYCYWADVTVNGTVYTSSRNYITLMPDHNVAESVQAEVTSGNAEALTDGVINDVTGGNLVKWSSDKNDSDPTMTFDFGQEKTLTRVNLFYNRGTVDTDSVAYINVPKQVKIEYSLDGKEWKTGNEITELTGDTLPTVESYDQVPTSDKTSYAWEAENIFYNYPVDQDESTVNARYVRISFPGGGQNGTCVDILEARVFGLGSEGGSEEPPAAADKTLLQKTYDYALTLSTDGVVDSAKKFFEDAKTAAAAVLADETATQEEVNAAWDNLLEGIWGLGLVQGDKSSLELLISLGESMMLDADKYVAENWQQFVDAFTEAKAVYEDGDALEDDVQTVSDALLDAILIQRYKADKSILADLIAKTEGIDTAQYTEASAQVFQAAFASAKAMLADESLSIDQQAQVDEMVCTLQAALDGLEPVSTDDGRDEPSGGDDGNTSDDGNTGNDDNTNDPGNGSSDSGNNGNTGGSDRGTGASDEKADTGNSGNTRSGKDAPKTGDNSNVAAVLLILAAAVAAGAGTVFVRKWKKGNK